MCVTACVAGDGTTRKLLPLSSAVTSIFMSYATDDPDARRLQELPESFEMIHHVEVTTHNSGGSTLDPLIYRVGQKNGPFF